MVGVGVLHREQGVGDHEGDTEGDMDTVTQLLRGHEEVRVWGDSRADCACIGDVVAFGVVKDMLWQQEKEKGR